MPAGFAFPLGSALGVAAVTGAVALGATHQPVLSLVALVVVVDAVAMLSTTTATLATAVVCWALQAGFVLGRHGELAFTAQAAGDATVLLLCALTARGLSVLIRSTPAAAVEIPAPRQPAALVPSGVARHG